MTTVMALDLVLALLNRSAEISALIRKAQAEGRDKFTAEEFAQIVATNDAARASLVDAIDKAKAAGK